MFKTATVALPPKPYNLQTLGGQTAALYDLVSATPDTFAYACNQAQQVARILDVPRGQLLQTQISSFNQVADFRFAIIEACRDPLSAAVRDLARFPTPRRLRAECILDVAAFSVFAEAGIVSTDAAATLIESARRYTVEDVDEQKFGGLKRLKILSVESREEDTLLQIRTLEEQGFDPLATRVETTDEFAAALTDKSWDVILADYALPQFGVRAALDIMRKSERDIPFIIVSGTIEPKMAAEMMMGGARDYILKNDLTRLAPTVARELKAHRIRQEHKKMAEDLLHAAEEWRATFDSISDIVCVVDLEGRIVRANLAMKKFLGMDFQDIIGQDYHRLLHGNQNKIQTSPGVVQAGERCFRVSVDPILNEETNLRAVVYIMTDITERRRLEEQLRHAQKMEALGQLAGGVVHDFNNLLSVIMGLSDLLKDSISPDDPIKGDITEIRRASDRASELTKQLLAFSRKQKSRPIELNLNQAIDSASKTLRRLIGEDIEIKVIKDDRIAHTMMDPVQFEQVIFNLAVNARDAMPDGGTLTIETRNIHFVKSRHLELEPGDHVLLTISDTGCGMDKETASHIFEPFYTTKEQGKGTGLGLSTVYGIIRQHGGIINVYSEPGGETTFRIYLPAVERATTLHPRDTATMPSLKGTETVLVVEDDPTVQRLIERILDLKGYTVLTASNGHEALKVSRQHEGTIHLVLTDVVMPRMGGAKLAEELASLRPEIKILYMSGYSDDAISRQGLLEEDKEILEKPLSPYDLTKKVREMLDKKPT